MHREISHTDTALAPPRNVGLYLMTGLLGVVIVADLVLWWFSGQSEAPGTVFGFRLAFIAAVLGAARILYASIVSFLEGRLGADIALAIAVIASIYLREYLVAAEIVFIGMFGECLEAFTFERTQRAVRKLVEVFPRRCWLLRDGQEVRVLTSELKEGDRVVVKPGARVPVDGTVVDGRSAVDVSALTGEAVPVEKGIGDEVLAGSLNQFGALTIDAVRVAEHTVVGQVIDLTARALRDKAPLERTADRLARYFLPAVLGLAALTFLVAWLHFGAGWFGSGRLPFSEAFQKSLIPAVTVLVVACPCALILATPAAIIAALGRLAGTGVLLKGGAALERLAQVDAIAFDKTGTLTEGRLTLGDVAGFGGVSNDEVLRLAASVETNSEHLIAQLIVREAQSRNLTLETVDGFEAHPGAGVVGHTAIGRILVGTPRLLQEQGISLPAEVHTVLEGLDANGQTALLVARDGVAIGAIGARDTVRPEAAAILQELAALGIRDMAMLTGDRRAAATAVAKALGIDQVHAELLPQQKCDVISAMRRQSLTPSPRRGEAGIHVAMVGDGINDAPALASADVGIAIGGTGTDIAAEAGEIVMMGAPLKPLPLLVRLSRETVRIIRQNILIFAFGVNGFGVLITAWLWPLLAPDAWYNFGPLAGVIYHQLGSFAVLLNSMRLLWFERRATSGPTAQARHTFDRLDKWIETYLDVDEGLHWLGHHWRGVSATAALLLAAVWALSGFSQIGPDESAIVLRFGKPVAVLEPGLHYSWPWPVGRVVRLQPERTRTVQIGLRGNTPGEKSALWGDTKHGGEKRDDIAEQTLMMTGDNNLVEVQATIRFRVISPKTYLFDVLAPERIVSDATESVLRMLIAARPLPELLTLRRDELQREAAVKVQERTEAYGIGIQIEGFALHDIHPPFDVVPAYYEVTKAMEMRDKAINEAQADATLAVGTAQADYLRRVTSAQTSKLSEIYDAQVKWAEFRSWAGVRGKLHFDDEWRLLLDLVDDLHAGVPPTQACDAYAASRKAALAAHQEIIDTRLYWDRFAGSLKDRDVLLIDAEQVHGRRTLILFDLDPLRLPVLLPDRDGTPRLPIDKGP